jgi:branched-chain amino acid transport system permease protein
MSDVALKETAVARGIPDWAREILPWLLVAVVLAVLPHLLTTSFGRTLLTEMGIAIIFAVAFNLLLGETGLLSFGHAIYFGLGGYTAIHVLRAIAAGLALPVALLPLVGGLGGLFFGLLFGFLSTRRAGTAFAMITLGLMELVVALALIFDHLFGGEEGISANRTSGPSLFGFDFGSQLQVYYLIAAWMLISLALMRAFTRTPVGRLCNAVRDNAERVRFLGYDPARIRLIAFAVSSFFAGVAGGLFAINYELMAINSLGAERSAIVLLMAYIGGIGSFFGPIIGAVLVTFLQVALSDYTQAWLLYLGLFFVLVTLFAPNGLVGLVSMHAPFARAGVLHRLMPAYALALVPAALLALGLITLIEINYRLSIRPELGSAMKLFGVGFDAKQPTAWVVSLALVAFGILGLRYVAPVVATRWSAALDEAQGS